LCDQILKEFSKGNLQKAVPYLFAHSQDHMTCSQLCRSLTNCLHFLKESSGYIYGHWNAQKGVLGLTPELLFSHSKKKPFIVNTMALAGTCAIGEEAIFTEDEKDHKEHQFVIQGIQQSLKKIGKVTLGEKQVIRLPTLFHLMTPIDIHLTHDFHFDTMVHALHPTPALGAFPPNRQWEWLKKYQIHIPRLHYGAPIGYIDCTREYSQCVVGIRNIQWNTTGMHIGAGCGVIQESLFEKEWKEIQLKIYSIRKLLAV
jgi:isochorismate synthase EntC